MMTDEEKEAQMIRNGAIWAMRLGGAKYREIARRFNISIARVQQIIKCENKEYEEFSRKFVSSLEREC